MNQELILLLIAAYLRKLVNPTENNAQIADGVTNDLKKFRAYLKSLDKSEIDQ